MRLILRIWRFTFVRVHANSSVRFLRISGNRSIAYRKAHLCPSNKRTGLASGFLKRKIVLVRWAYNLQLRQETTTSYPRQALPSPLFKRMWISCVRYQSRDALKQSRVLRVLATGTSFVVPGFERSQFPLHHWPPEKDNKTRFVERLWNLESSQKKAPGCHEQLYELAHVMLFGPV